MLLSRGLVFFLCLICFSTFAQKVASTDPSFSFKDGFYLSLDEYKNNNPSIPLSKFCTKEGVPTNDIVISRIMYYQNDTAGVSRLKVDSIFGYCIRGNFYMHIREQVLNNPNSGLFRSGNFYFGRLVVIGSLSHFVCEITQTYNSSMGGSGYPGYGASVPMNTTSLQQFVFDYETGKIEEFSMDSFLSFLKRDETLYAEFMSLSNKSRKKSLFIYLRKYNQKHTIYFPT